MSYRVTFRPAAERQFTKLQKSARADVLLVIATLADQPRPHGCKKLEGAERTYRVRVGSYRIVYDVDDAAKTVQVVAVAHRKDLSIAASASANGEHDHE